MFLKSVFRRQSLSTTVCCNSKQKMCFYHTGVSPVKMSYTSYESTSLDSSSTSENPLIIMHGLFGSKSNWNSLSKAIHSRCKKKVINVDARNHGESPHTNDFSYNHLAADVYLLMEELNLKKSNLLGHSMGGRAMMTFALTYPELVDSLIVVDISPVNSSTNMINMSSYFEALKSIRLERNMTMSQARKSADDQLSNKIPDLAIRQFLLTNLTQIEGGRFKWRVNLDVLANQFEANIMRFPEIKSKCEMPSLFIGGLKSDYLRKEDHATITKYFPAAEFQYLNTGHWVHAEQPAEFINIVCNFLSRNHSGKT